MVFATASLFKVLTLSILAVFFKAGAFFMIPGYFFLIIFGYCFVLLIFLGITVRCYNLKNWWQQFGESLVISWLTITNLESGKTAAICRLVSILYWTTAHTITFTVIIAICNTDPGIVNDGKQLVWSELPLVHDLFTLNILLISTICLGWGSLVLDVITAAVKNHYRSRNNTEDQEEASFWDGAILLEGLKY